MVRLSVSAFAVATICLAAEGTVVKPKPSDYPVHVRTADVTLAADYTVRTVIAPARTVFLRDYLAVEVAIYPELGKQIIASSSRFRLRLNGSKGVLYPQSAGMVAASLKYADWERRPALIAEAGPVIIGRPPATSRFPGDPTPNPRTPPMPPPASGAPADTPNEPVRDDEIVTDLGLREAPVTLPVSGYLYFAWKGKPEKLRTVELLFEAQPESEPVVLRLR
jgi:hypothetical protein